MYPVILQVLTEYEVVWSGGEGLTRVGAQRPGCVAPDTWAGDAAEWAGNIEWRQQHTYRTGTDQNRLTTIADRIFWSDVAGPPTEYVAQLIRALFDRRLTRLLTHDRRYAWQHCQLCGEEHPQYIGGRHKRRPHFRRLHRTPSHASVCQSCYVRLRDTRGRWAGMQGLAAYRLAHQLTPAEQKARATERSRRYYANKKARDAQEQAARAQIVARLRRARGLTAAPAS